MRYVLRLAMIPVIVVLSAWSFIEQSLAPGDDVDRARRRHCFGWLAPEMEGHWMRLKATMWSGEFDHAAKNVLAEWVRLDPQRAGKLFAFVLCVTVAVIAVLVAVR